MRHIIAKSLTFLLFVGCLLPISAQATYGSIEKFIVVPYSKTTPAFPKLITDYKLSKVKHQQSVRVFKGDAWVIPIPEFDPSQNGAASMSCQQMVWVLRWRSNYPEIIIQVSTGMTDGGHYSRVSKTYAGGAGYLSGPSCQIPALRFGKTLNGNESTLEDVNYEYEIWKYAPRI
jgi:hypothetical protein